MMDNGTVETRTSRIAFLNCFNSQLYVSDVIMSETEEIQLNATLTWLRDAGVLLLPANELVPCTISVADVIDHVRRSVGDLLVDTALSAEPTHLCGNLPQPIAVMPVWPFTTEGDDCKDRDVLLSSGRLWGNDILLEALRVDDHDNPVPVCPVRSRYDRWIKAAGGGRLRAVVHVPGEKGGYFVAGAAAPM
jgi:hypothetical protein